MNSARHFEEFEIDDIEVAASRLIGGAEGQGFHQFMCIGEGTNGMQRIIIARQMLEKHPL